ncbi:hypothetical protein V7193_14250, partial [Bacillus velezensis]
MKRSISIFITCLLIAVLTMGGLLPSPASAAGTKTPVAKNGQLSIKG